MSPNWREKEAMSTQKLMAATTHLHLKQDEEITRLRRNVSSLAKKNHGLMRQVHELVSRLRQYPPPRIPEETRPTNQDEETQEDPSPETKEDTQMKDVAEPQVNDDSSLYSLFEPKPREPTPQQSMEYEILPDAVEDSPTPTPTPTPPIQQAQLQPLPPSHLPPPPALPAPISEAKRTIKEPARVEHTPLPETPIPVDTHPDEEVISVTIVATGDGRFDRQCEKRMRYNAIRKEEEAMTIRGWMWYSKIGGEHALCGEETAWGPRKETYSIKAIKRRNRCIINLEDIREFDREVIAGHNGKYVIGFPGPRGERERTQIVIR